MQACLPSLVTCFLEVSRCCSFPTFFGCLSRALQSSDMCYRLSATMPTAKQACKDTLVPSPQNNHISKAQYNSTLCTNYCILTITLCDLSSKACVSGIYTCMHSIVHMLRNSLNARNLHKSKLAVNIYLPSKSFTHCWP